MSHAAPVHPIPRDPEADEVGLKLHWKVLIGFVLGAVVGLAVHVYALDAPLVQVIIADLTKPFGQVFLNLLFMMVIPLMVTALILGIGELGDIASLGRFPGERIERQPQPHRRIAGNQEQVLLPQCPGTAFPKHRPRVVVAAQR